MAESFKKRKGKRVPKQSETKKRVQDHTGKIGRPKNEVERKGITTNIDVELKQYLKIQSAKEDRPMNEILEDAIRLYMKD